MNDLSVHHPDTVFQLIQKTPLRDKILIIAFGAAHSHSLHGTVPKTFMMLLE
jgi:hypothetical protein